MGIPCPTIFHCPSYPTVPWDRWDCPWKSTVPLWPTKSYCPSYPTVPCRIGGTIHGNTLSHSGPPNSTVRPILLYHVGQVGLPWESTIPFWPNKSYCPSYPTVPCRIGGTVHGNTLTHSGPPNPTVRPIPLYHVGQVGPSMGIHCPTLAHQILLSIQSHCTMYDRWYCPWEFKYR